MLDATSDIAQIAPAQSSAAKRRVASSPEPDRHQEQLDQDHGGERHTRTHGVFTPVPARGHEEEQEPVDRAQLQGPDCHG